MLNCPRKFVQIIFLEKNDETEKTVPKEKPPSGGGAGFGKGKSAGKGKSRKKKN